MTQPPKRPSSSGSMPKGKSSGTPKKVPGTPGSPGSSKRKKRKGTKTFAPKPGSKRDLQLKRQRVNSDDYKKILKRVDPTVAKATAPQLKFIRELAAVRPSVYMGREPEKLMGYYTRAEASLLIDRLLAHSPEYDFD